MTKKEKIDKYKFEFIKIKFLPIKVFFHLVNGKDVKSGRRYLQDIISQNAQESEIDLTKDVKDLHAEKYKTLVKETEDESTKW